MKLIILSIETNRKDKEKNRQTLQLAEAIKAKRVVELQNGEYGFNAAYKLETNFLDYYRAMCEKRHGNPESRETGVIGIAASNTLNGIASLTPHSRT